MKKSVKNVITLLTAVTVSGFLLYGAAVQQPEPVKKVDANNKAVAKPWVCPEKATKLNNPVQPQEGLIETGKEIWNSQCKSCHGKYGKGDGVKASKIDIPVTDFTSLDCQKTTDGELFYKTTEGRKPMPSFKDKLSDIDRWCVVLYIRTFAEN